jgi:flagellar biogenesis protein FliO
MRRVRRGLLSLALLLGSVGAAAVEPAGGPPEPSGGEEVVDEEVADPSASTGPDAPDASLVQRSWLAKGSSPTLQPAAETSSGSSGFTLGALLLVLGLGAAAVVLHFRKRKLGAAPLTASEARLTVLSSSRIGPKAFAVSAHVGGRVVLLGVTDHNVTHLAWLDGPERDGELADAAAEEAKAAPAEADDLPVDYPGSSLRVAPLRTPALASAHDLRRFREVLRGVQGRPDLARFSLHPDAPSAASTLAAQTSDVMSTSSSPAERASPRASSSSMSSSESAASPSVSSSAGPNSLRRKRQRRQESVQTQPTKAPSAQAPQATEEPEVEGQVAGLRALKNR